MRHLRCGLRYIRATSPYHQHLGRGVLVQSLEHAVCSYSWIALENKKKKTNSSSIQYTCKIPECGLYFAYIIVVSADGIA